MYSDVRKKRPAWLVPLIVLLVLALVLVLSFVRVSRRDLSEESAMAIRDAIQRSALQCYVVEGVYPPDLDYLRDNYGLQVNTKDFYVTYDAFASNLPPTVLVTSKHGN